MSDQKPKYLLVENKIKLAIQRKEFEKKLPGERQLALKYDVSYMTIRKSIESLVQQGVLYKKATKGTYINEDQKPKRNNKTIGYFLDKTIISGISSPYYSLIYNAIEKVASDHGYSVMYFSDNNAENINGILDKLDGVIGTCFPRVESILQEIKDAVPLVVLDNSSVDKTIPSVILDNFKSVFDSFDYIWGLGHRRIGFMTGLDDSDVGRSRYAGYQHGLSYHRASFDEALVFRGNYSFQAGLEGAEYFQTLDDMPTALICANDSMALGAMQKLSQLGLSIPDDISVIGFDNIEIASQIVPALTTIAAPVDEIAAHAFTLLNNLMNIDPIQNNHIVLPAPLLKRGSCIKLKG